MEDLGKGNQAREGEAQGEAGAGAGRAAWKDLEINLRAMETFLIGWECYL